MKINDKSIYLRFILKQGQGIRYGGNVAFASADPSRGPFLYTLRETSKHQVIFRTRGELAKSEYMRIIQSNSKRRMFARSLHVISDRASKPVKGYYSRHYYWRFLD